MFDRPKVKFSNLALPILIILILASVLLRSETGVNGCIKSTANSSHVLLGPYSKTTLNFPIAYFGSRLDLSLSSTDSVKIKVKLDDMSPACLSDMYGKSGKKSTQIFNNIKLKASAPELVKSEFKQMEETYDEFISTDQYGFKAYRAIHDVRDNKQSSIRELLIPPDSYFGSPVRIVCTILEPDPKDQSIEKNCTLHTLFENNLFIEYGFHSSHFEDLKNYDRRMKEFTSSILTENTTINKDKMVSYDEPFCEGTVLTKVGLISLRMPRSYSARREGNRWDLGKDSYKYNCGINEINKIEIVHFHPFDNKERMSISSTLRETTFEEYGRTTQSIFDQGLYKRLESGMFQYGGKHMDRFFIPNEILKTRNNQPIIIECSGSEEIREEYTHHYCVAKYVHPSGLYVHHSYSRRLNKPFTEYEMLKSRYFEINHMIEAAKH